jgi:hypothetical protein
MKSILLFLMISISCYSQQNIALDSIKLLGVTDALADDYGNFYFYKDKDFSWTKYNKDGQETARIMLAQPYQIQEVQNPLNLPFFSQNEQAIKLLDAHFTEIQKINLSPDFGFISAAYLEDLQQVWLLEENTNRLLQYNYRDGKIINSYPFFIHFSGVKSMLVYEQRLYILREKSFEIYNFQGESLYKTPLEYGRKLGRENDKIYVLSKNSIIEIEQSEKPKSIFQNEKSRIIFKNTNSIFAIQENKIYIYPLK